MSTVSQSITEVLDDAVWSPRRAPTPQRAPDIEDATVAGVVALRLVGARADDRGLVERQLGPLQPSVGRDPDIELRFVDDLGLGRCTHVTIGETTFDDAGFVVRRGPYGAKVAVRLDLGTDALPFTVTVERGSSVVPHLVDIVNLAAAARGVVAVHAAAFVHQGRGVLVTGWAKGGKTETLLAFMVRGATYIGDEWVLVDPCSRRMYGLPEPMRVHGWQLDQQAALAGRVPPRQRARVRLLTSVQRATTAALGTVQGRPPTGRFEQVVAALGRQASVRVAPAHLFGPQRCEPSASLDCVVLAVSTESPGVTVHRSTGRDVAARVEHSLAFERFGVLSAYRQFRYAFPDRRSALLEHAVASEPQLLAAALEGVPAVVLSHPHPVRLSSLYDASAAFLGQMLP